jgi:hypothetical protein
VNNTLTRTEEARETEVRKVIARQYEGPQVRVLLSDGTFEMRPNPLNGRSGYGCPECGTILQETEGKLLVCRRAIGELAYDPERHERTIPPEGIHRAGPLRWFKVVRGSLVAVHGYGLG